MKKMINEKKITGKIVRLTIMILAVLMTLSACTSTPELLAGIPAYEDMPEIEKCDTSYSRSAFGNKFGKVTITINIKDERIDRVECTDAFYLEYTTFDDDIGYEPIVVQNESDSLCNETYTFKPFKKQKMVVDVDSYYDFCPNGHYRMVKIFDVKYYNGKTEQRKVYFPL